MKNLFNNKKNLFLIISIGLVLLEVITVAWLTNFVIALVTAFAFIIAECLYHFLMKSIINPAEAVFEKKYALASLDYNNKLTMATAFVLNKCQLKNSVDIAANMSALNNEYLADTDKKSALMAGLDLIYDIFTIIALILVITLSLSGTILLTRAVIALIVFYFVRQIVAILRAYFV